MIISLVSLQFSGMMTNLMMMKWKGTPYSVLPDYNQLFNFGLPEGITSNQNTALLKFYLSM